MPDYSGLAGKGNRVGKPGRLVVLMEVEGEALVH
jgi:hypothetical protein